MIIQFHEPTWVVKHTPGGFSGHGPHEAALINPEPFQVIDVARDKKTQCSQIHAGWDGCHDGEHEYLVNVANGLFKILPFTIRRTGRKNSRGSEFLVVYPDEFKGLVWPYVGNLSQEQEEQQALWNAERLWLVNQHKTVESI